jgi:hypothetical protein
MCRGLRSGLGRGNAKARHQAGLSVDGPTPFGLVILTVLCEGSVIDMKKLIRAWVKLFETGDNFV